MVVSKNMKWAILGASRGLGKHLYLELISKYPRSSFLISSRKDHLLTEIANSSTTVLKCDFTQPEPYFWEKFIEFAPTHIIYNAGGGAYGRFESKDWKDHFWTLKLNLLFPMELTHRIFKENLKYDQICFIGSQVADSVPDIHASSYCASKHGLRGFVETLKLENPTKDIRWVRPPYMETDLLPLNSKPREMGIAQNPQKIALEIIESLSQSS